MATPKEQAAQQRDDRLRQLALQESVNTIRGGGASWTTSLLVDGAEKFYAFLTAGTSNDTKGGDTSE